MYRFFLAIRWLASRPIGIVTMIGIWLSVMATVVTVSVMTGFLRDHERLARGTTSDLVIAPRASRAPDGATIAAADFATIRSAIAEVPGIARSSPRLVRPGLIRFDRVEASIVMGERRYLDRNNVRIVGVDPAQDGGAADFREHLKLSKDVIRRSSRPERWASDPAVDDPDKPFSIRKELLPVKYRNLRLPVVLIGIEMFDYFKLRKGDRVNLVTIPLDADPNQPLKPLSEPFIVGGAVATGNNEFDGFTVYLALDRAKRFTRSTTDVTEVCLALEAGRDLETTRDAVHAALESAGIRARVDTWRERGSRLLDAVSNERAIIGVLLFFFIVVACFNVLSTLTILVTDKTRDIGVLGALGAKPRGIQSIFLLNGLLMALIAGTLGVRYGVKLTESLNPINDWFDERFGVSLFPREVFVFDAVPFVIQPAFVIGTFVVTLCLALLCAWIPARRAARFDPVEALRYE